MHFYKRIQRQSEVYSMTFLIEENGMLFEYDTNKKEDIDAFFDGAVNENVFQKCYLKCDNLISKTGWKANAKTVSLDFVQGAMEDARDKLLK